MVLACLHLLVSPSAQATSSDSTGTIAGRVHTARDNGAHVLVLVKALRRGAQTDERGNFVLKNIPAGQHEIMFMWPKCTFPDTCTVIPGAITHLDLRLDLVFCRNDREAQRVGEFCAVHTWIQLKPDSVAIEFGFVPPYPAYARAMAKAFPNARAEWYSRAIYYCSCGPIAYKDYSARLANCALPA